MSGKYGIHPSYIQEMINDTRYDDEDILAVTNQLRSDGGKSFNYNSLDLARKFYVKKIDGTWSPTDDFKDKDVLILGSGPGTCKHSSALESYIKKHSPLVLALNTRSVINSSLINLRIACHPVRLIADAEEYNNLSQPLITPISSLPESLRHELINKKILDYGLSIEINKFECHATQCVLPSPLVLAYALAVATSGHAKQILLAGFDGYSPGDPRNEEIESLFSVFLKKFPKSVLFSVTPTTYKAIPSKSIYAMY